MKTKKMILSIIGSLLILIISQVTAQLLASALLSIKVPEFVCNGLAGILYIVFAFYLIRLLCKKYIKEDMSDYKIPKCKIEIRWLIIAIVLPILISACYLLFLDGSLKQNEISMQSKLSMLSTGIFFIGFGAGIVEEMVFRGIMMTVIEKRFHKKIAIIVPSLLFGLVHIIGMKMDILSAILVIFAGTMVGIMFSLIASETKSIWNSAIVHAVWNIVIVGGIISIGTEFDEYSLYSYILNTKSFILTGGEFGIESSMIAVLGYTVVSVLVLVISRKKNSSKS